MRHTNRPTAMDRMYGLDIRGTRLVIDENWTPDTTDSERTDLHAVVESLRISR
jgi:hypothetical protein